MNRELLFPTPIWQKDFPNSKKLNKHLFKHIKAWSKTDKSMEKTNAGGGWHSPTNMGDKKEYKPLLKELFIMAQELFKDYGLEPECALGNMWANINPPGGMNRAHQHPNSLWSGVYYVKALPNSGHLKVEDPRAAASMSRPRQKEGPTPSRLWRETHFDPKPGRLIMFPAWLTHCVDPNNSNDIRISISFNFMQRCFNV